MSNVRMTYMQIDERTVRNRPSSRLQPDEQTTISDEPVADPE